MTRLTLPPVQVITLWPAWRWLPRLVGGVVIRFSPRRAATYRQGLAWGRWEIHWGRAPIKRETMKMEIERRVRDLVVAVMLCDPETVTPDADLRRDLGMDSLDAVEIAMEAEEEFGIHVADDAVSGIDTFAGLVALIENLAREQRHG